MQIKQLKNMRRETKSKEKINWMADMDFCMVNPQFKEEREGKERKKIKVILGPNHDEPPYTCHQ